MVGVLEPEPGDFIHLPSGRLHAIGAGLLIFEIQQNSDTTYRVFDWNRLGLDGKPRDLHVEEALRSIDFEDTEVSLGSSKGDLLVSCDYYEVRRWELEAGTARTAGTPGEPAIFAVMDGSASCKGEIFVGGEFFLVPAPIGDASLEAGEDGATLLRISIPPAKP